MTTIKGLGCDAPIERYVDSLGDDGFPATAIVACLLRYDEAGPLLASLVTRASENKVLVDFDTSQLFDALHIMAGARDTRAFTPLLQLLRRPEDAVETLLEMADFTLPRLFISIFDGNHEVMFEAIRDSRIGDLHRSALLASATYLAWEGRIDRDRMIAFLREFDAPDESTETPHLWGSWVMAIAHLGLRELEQAGRRAFEDDRVGDTIDEPYFEQVLDEAEADPRSTARLDIDDLGYIDNALETLQRCFEDARAGEERADDEDDEYDADSLYIDRDREVPVALARPRPAPFEVQGPIINPMRKVGRNDPCLCGSGKKAKRCCLAT